MLVLPMNWDGSISKYISILCVCCLFGRLRETEVV